MEFTYSYEVTEENREKNSTAGNAEHNWLALFLVAEKRHILPISPHVTKVRSSTEP